MARSSTICVGTFAGAHGVKGLVRLRSFTEEPEAILAYGPLSDEGGKRVFAVRLKSSANDHFIAEVEGVTGREEAEALRGVKLFVLRAALPKLKKREYYEADLVGLAAEDKKGKACGKVAAVHNYGGGPFLEIVTAGGNFMLPFTKTCAPEVEVEEGRIVIDPPPGWMDAGAAEKRGRA